MVHKVSIPGITVKPIHIKVLRIGTGLGLMFVAGRYIYVAISLEVVEWRTGVYSLQDSPISFCFFVGIFIVAFICGVSLVKLGWQDDGI